MVKYEYPILFTYTHMVEKLYKKTQIFGFGSFKSGTL